MASGGGCILPIPTHPRPLPSREGGRRADLLVAIGGCPMIAFWIAMASLAIWLVLVFARDGFWQTSERDTMPIDGAPAQAGAQSFERGAWGSGLLPAQ